MTISDLINAPTNDDGITIAICVRSTRLTQDLVEHACAIVPGPQVLSLRDLSEWHGQAAHRSWLIVDAQLLRPEHEKVLAHFRHLVVFNCSLVDPRVLSTLLSQKEGPFLQLVDDAYLGSDLQRDCAHLFLSRNKSRSADHLVRYCSADPQAGAAIINSNDTIVDRGVSSFLTFLNGNIATDASRILTEYVDVPSQIEPISREAQAVRKASELPDAAREITDFISDKENRGRGHFVIGPAGAGKSTLTSYVLADLETKHDIISLRVDCTFLTAQQLLRSPFIPILFQHHEMVQALVGATGAPDSGPEAVQVAAAARRLVESGDYNRLPPIPNVLLDAAHYACQDRGVLQRMFSLYARPILALGQQSSEGERLSSEVDSWEADLKKTPKRLFALYLDYVMRYQHEESFGAFSYKAILDGLFTKAHLDSSLGQLLSRTPITSQLVPVVPELIAKGDFHEAQLGLEHLSLADVTNLSFRYLRAIENTGRIVTVFIDNLDQRTDGATEALLIANAMALFREGIARRLDNARAIIAMRDSTFASNPWVNRPEIWRHTEIRPPDLRSVIRKRCDVYGQRGRSYGSGEATAFISGLRESLDTGRRDPRLDAKRRRRADMCDVIERRHPFNVREQLLLFCNCSRNSLLHREYALSKAKGLEGRRTTHDVKIGRRDGDGSFWTERSFEHFVRVFVLQDRTYFREDSSRLPNMYDNGHSSSPFNACLRIWISDRIQKATEGDTPAGTIAHWTQRGVPEIEVADAVDALSRFDIIRQRRLDGPLEISVWGDYFCDNIVCDLPYVSSIWWTVHMLKEYSLGPPREVKPKDELRELSDRFVRWIREEEAIAIPLLREQEEPIASIWERVSHDLHESISHITRSIQ